MTSIPMNYPVPAHMHPHDIVFHQMLRSAQLPSAMAFRPDRPAIDVYARLERRASLATQRASQSSDDSDADDGYDADRDNGPSKLLKVTCDFFLEITPTSSGSRKARCHACHSELRSSTYRLRSIDTNELFHVPCFESQYNLDQGFGRIYPSQDRLDGGVRDLVKTWKMQRRREGLTEAAGPDSGIPTGMASLTMVDSPKIGQKRASVEAEDEAERKRAKLERRQTEPVVLGYRHVVPPVMPPMVRSRSSVSRSRQSSTDEASWLPMKLSDALKRLDGPSSLM